MSRIRRIVCATDFSGGSRKAFATAVDLARTNRAALIVIHVVEPIAQIAPEQFIGSSAWAEIESGTRAWARRQLAALVENAKKKRVRATALLFSGRAADQIVRAARSRRASLLVLGTHGRRGLSRLFLGSVAERVVATAPCPVVTVRSK